MNNYFRNVELVECSKLINNVEIDERELMIKYRHESKTNHSIQESYKSLKNDVINYINNCEICQRTKYDRKPPDQP